MPPSVLLAGGQRPFAVSFVACAAGFFAMLLVLGWHPRAPAWRRQDNRVKN
jgi:hypothetical protein